MGSGNSSPAKRLEYLCSGEPSGPYCACCLCSRRASADEGGENNVMERSSYLDFSPIAVERDMVGKDNEAGFMDCDARYACCAALAAWSAAASVPGLGRCEPPKRAASLELALESDERRGS